MNSKYSGNSRLVYSTEVGSVCSRCEKPLAQCECAQKEKLKVRGDGTVRVRRETNGRGGKTVSTVAGLALNDTDLKALLGELKRSCGTGGSIKEGVLEIQGDHCDHIIRELTARGYKPKRAGG